MAGQRVIIIFKWENARCTSALFQPTAGVNVMHCMERLTEECCVAIGVKGHTQVYDVVQSHLQPCHFYL